MNRQVRRSVAVACTRRGNQARGTERLRPSVSSTVNVSLVTMTDSAVGVATSIAKVFMPGLSKVIWLRWTTPNMFLPFALSLRSAGCGLPGDLRRVTGSQYVRPFRYVRVGDWRCWRLAMVRMVALMWSPKASASTVRRSIRRSHEWNKLHSTAETYPCMLEPSPEPVMPVTHLSQPSKFLLKKLLRPAHMLLNIGLEAFGTGLPVLRGVAQPPRQEHEIVRVGLGKD